MELRIKPTDFAMSVEECPPGLLVYYSGDKYMICLKSEYGSKVQYYDALGDAISLDSLDKVRLFPVKMIENGE